MEIWQEGICWKVYPYHRRRHYDNLDYLLHQHLIKISVNTDQSPKDVLPCLCGSWRERFWEQCFNIHLIEISISRACFCFYPVASKPTRKKTIPADSGRCGICLVFRVSPGTWRVNVFSPKFLTHLFIDVFSPKFLTHLIGMMLPDEREPHNLPWQCLGSGCCYSKIKLCSFWAGYISNWAAYISNWAGYIFSWAGYTYNWIYTTGLFWWLPSHRQHCRLNICRYIGWIDKYCICQFNKYVYKYWDDSAVLSTLYTSLP